MFSAVSYLQFRSNVDGKCVVNKICMREELVYDIIVWCLFAIIQSVGK
jgi:hypothetical protein